MKPKNSKSLFDSASKRSGQRSNSFVNIGLERNDNSMDNIGNNDFENKNRSMKSIQSREQSVGSVESKNSSSKGGANINVTNKRKELSKFAKQAAVK